MQYVQYTVRPGDTLDRIAAQHASTAQAIAQANGISFATDIGAGQVLTIPSNSTAAPLEEITVTAHAAPDWMQWLKPPKVYGLAAVAVMLAYALATNDKKR